MRGDLSPHGGFHEKSIAVGAPPNFVWESGLLFVVMEGSDGDIDAVITDPEADLQACRDLRDRLTVHLDGQTASRWRRSDGSRTLSGQSPARVRQLLTALRKYTGMCVRDPYYEKVCRLVRGMDWIVNLSLTAGLRERVAAAGGPPHLDWDDGFPHTVFPDDPAPLRTMLNDARADACVTRELLDLIRDAWTPEWTIEGGKTPFPNWSPRKPTNPIINLTTPKIFCSADHHNLKWPARAARRRGASCA